MAVLKPEAKLQSIFAINGILDLTQEIWTFSRESRFFFFFFLQLLGECEERKKRSKGRTGRGGEREKEGRGERDDAWKRTILCLWTNVMLNKKLE